MTKPADRKSFAEYIIFEQMPIVGYVQRVPNSQSKGRSAWKRDNVMDVQDRQHNLSKIKSLLWIT